MTIGVDVFEDRGDEVQAVGIEHRKQTVVAFLEMPVGGEAMA